jgi:hypothetical protein
VVDCELRGADRVRDVDFERGVGTRVGFIEAGFEMPEVGPGLVCVLY